MIQGVLKELLKIVGKSVITDELMLKCKKLIPSTRVKNIVAERKLSDDEIKFVIFAVLQDRFDLICAYASEDCCQYSKLAVLADPIRICYINEWIF